MWEKLDMMLLTVMAFCGRTMDRLAHEEKGASDMIAILLIVVILVAVAVIFKDQLIKLVNQVFDRTVNFVNQD